MKRLILFLLIISLAGCKSVKTNKSVIRTTIDSTAHSTIAKDNVSHVDSNNITHQQQVIQQSNQTTDSTNIKLSFSKDSTHSSPIIISTDSTGTIIIDVGNRPLTDLSASKKHTVVNNNTNATATAQQTSVKKNDSTGIQKSTDVNVNKTTDAVVKNKSKMKISIMQIIWLIALIATVIIAWKNRSKILTLVKKIV